MYINFLKFKYKIQHTKYWLFALAFFFCFVGQASAATLVRPPNNLGLVGYWAFDEGTGLIAGDKSGNGLVGTSTAALFPTWTTGKYGRAVSFNGTSQYITLGVGTVGAKVNGATSITMSAWINPTAYPTSRARVVSFVQNTLTGGTIALNGATGNLEIGGRSVTSDTFQSVISSVIPQNRWTHVVGILNFSTDTISIYINGTFVSTTPVTFVSNTYVHQVFGANQDMVGAISGPNEFFSGKIDDVRVYNRQLSAAQVAALYQSGQTTRKQVSNQGLVGYWSLNEGTGLIANDSSGNGNKGTTTPSTAPTWVAGKRGGALKFDGVDDKITLGNISAFNFSYTLPFTLSAWVKPSALGSIGGIITKYGTTAGTRQYAMNIRSTGTIQCLREVVPFNVFSTTVLQIDRWYHVSCVYNGSTMSLYINGQSDATPVSLGSVSPINENVNIGNSENGDNFSGSVDEARIYNRALSATEIANLYRQTETKINSSQNDRLTNGLVGLWSFNGPDYDISSTTAEALDRSGQGNHGNAIGGPVPTIGKVGQALKFDGVDDYVDMGLRPSLDNLTQLSVCAWVKPASITTDDIIITKRISHGFQLFRDDVGAGGSDLYSFFVQSSASPNNRIESASNTTPVGVWTHVCGTFLAGSATGLNLYINGVSAATPVTTASVVDSGGTGVDLTIGNASGYFDGSLDEIRIYDRALTAAEVKQLYNLGK